jgi:hypothetical protein
MSMADIKIYRSWPIVAGYVQTPNQTDKDKTKTLASSLSSSLGEVVRLSLGSGKPRGSKCGQQEFFRLNGVAPNEWYASNPAANT